jgi:hypothetical protein
MPYVYDSMLDSSPVSHLAHRYVLPPNFPVVSPIPNTKRDKGDVGHENGGSRASTTTKM